MPRTFKPDWKCEGCLCNHGGRVKQHGSLMGKIYCEQTYFNAAKKLNISVDHHELAKKYAKGTSHVTL